MKKKPPFSEARALITHRIMRSRDERVHVENVRNFPQTSRSFSLKDVRAKIFQSIEFF